MRVTDETILGRAAELKQADSPFALVTVVRAVSPTSAKPGAKAIVQFDGEIQGWIGGGCAQPAVIKSARQALADGRPRLIRISPGKGAAVEEGIIDFAMSCHSGGTLDIFIDPVLPNPLLLIVGGSPVAQVLSGLAHRVGFDVMVACDGADRDAFPDATEAISGFDLDPLPTTRSVFVVVATQGKRDQRGLEAALDTGAEYIAFVASKKKASKLRDKLRERGYSEARLNAVRAPAGLEIGAATPEEIALSVLAGTVQARRAGLGSLTETAEGRTVSVEEGACCGASLGRDTGARAEVFDPVCGMSVDKDAAEHRFVFHGATYYFCGAGCQQTFAKTPGECLAARETRV